MQKEFVVVISTHRRLGELLLPYLIERKQGQSFFQLHELLLHENNVGNKYNLTFEAQEIVRITSMYSDKSICNAFGKKKSLKDFFDTLDDKLITDHIRPVIETRIIKCLDILYKSRIPVFRKEKNYQVVHDDVRIILENEPALPVFNFIRTETDFQYFLTVRHGNKDIKLNKLPTYTILTQMPCYVVLANKLYQVEDINSNKLLPFFTKDVISVRKQSEKEYMNVFVRNAIARYPVKSIGFKVLEIDPEKTAKVSLEYYLNGMPVFVLRFYYDDTVFQYGTKLQNNVILHQTDDNYIFYKINRDIVWETNICNALINLGFENIEGPNFIKSDFVGLKPDPLLMTEIITWLNFNKDKLTEQGIILERIKTEKDYYTDHVLLSFNVDESNDWFDVHAIVSFLGYTFPFSRFRKHIIMGIREFTLPNNQVFILPIEWFANFKEFFTFGDDNDTSVRLKKHHFQVLREALGKETGNMLLQLQEKLDFKNGENFPTPAGLQATLRDYQKIGIHWLYQLYKAHMGGCLADDMGLGKTLQTIALLCIIKEDSKGRAIVSENNTKSLQQLSLFDIPAFKSTQALTTSLIVMPVSLIHNWEAEFNKFAPTLKIYKFLGTQRTKNINDLLNVDVVITSYGIVRNDAEMLKNLNFKYIILDESQIIKNPDSKIYKAVTGLQSEHKMVLTGTPIENSLTDLWAQLNFLNRDLLKSQHYFKEEFVVPIEKHNDEAKQKKLQVIINPFILRRKKHEVVKELPPLTEQTLICEMSEAQTKIYEEEKSAIRNHIYESIDKVGFEKSSILILKGLTRLRLLANHPILTQPDYEGDSGKFEEITRHLENVLAEKHKLLVFSSYVKHLNLLSLHLNCRQVKHSMLTGSTRDRAGVIKDFQTDAENNVFLISLKAGGTGLNLTSADYVFMLDPWWNPAAENQAISRAHRIGQDKKVFVYRFISQNTIEEKILLLQNRKSAMADLFINTNNPFRTFGKNEIQDLFR